MASKTFEAAVRRVFAPRLVELGFERDGIFYYRPSPPWRVQVLVMQQGQYNGSGDCEFTINVARALVPAISRAGMVARAKARRKQSLDRFTWVRLGELSEIRGDYWYDYAPDDADGIEAKLREALDDIERFGMPYLRWGKRPVVARADTTRADAHRARFYARHDLQPDGKTSL